jgi:CspA family cold shock protein
MGRVKWFSDQLGYGFLTCIDDSVLQNTDIFVHYKAILCNTFKTLAKGEYVSFLVDEETSDRGMIAKDVMGVMRGPLLCQVGDVKLSNSLCNLHGDIPL